MWITESLAWPTQGLQQSIPISSFFIPDFEKSTLTSARYAQKRDGLVWLSDSSAAVKESGISFLYGSYSVSVTPRPKLLAKKSSLFFIHLNSSAMLPSFVLPFLLLVSVERVICWAIVGCILFSSPIPPLHPVRRRCSSYLFMGHPRRLGWLRGRLFVIIEKWTLIRIPGLFPFVCQRNLNKKTTEWRR